MPLTPKERRVALIRSYGLTPAQHAKMEKQQRGVCAICERPPKKRPLHIDHDHHTGRVRGLLCYRCNRFLVLGHITVRILRAAITYLDRAYDGREL